MGLARRQPAGGLDRNRNRSLIEELRDPVTSPPLPVPDRIACGQASPKAWPQLFLKPRQARKAKGHSAPTSQWGTQRTLSVPTRTYREVLALMDGAEEKASRPFMACPAAQTIDPPEAGVQWGCGSR